MLVVAMRTVPLAAVGSCEGGDGGEGREEVDSPLPRCWKEGENPLAVSLARRHSSWDFSDAAIAASALPPA